MKIRKIGVILLVFILLAGFVPQRSEEQEFISDWIQLAPGINTTIPYKLSSQALDVHVWTPLYLEGANRSNKDNWIQPIENLGGYVRIVYISDRKIVLMNSSDYPVWVLVYLR